MTGVLDCFWSFIFHHFPMKRSFNLTRFTRQDYNPGPMGRWMLSHLGVQLMFKWPTPQYTLELLHGGTLSWRQQPQSCMSILSRIKPSWAVASQYTHQSTSVGCSNLKPWQMWTCRCRDWRSHKGLSGGLLWGQERPSLISVALYNVLKILVLHRPTYLHTPVSSQAWDFQQTL